MVKTVNQAMKKKQKTGLYDHIGSKVDAGKNRNKYVRPPMADAETMTDDLLTCLAAKIPAKPVYGYVINSFISEK